MGTGFAKMGQVQGLSSSLCNEAGRYRRLLPSCLAPADSDPGRHFQPGHFHLRMP